MDVRNIARRVAPGLMADRARQHERRYREGLGLPDLARRLEPVVQAGPFAGMRYPPERFEEIDAPVAKLLGTYEMELHPIVEAHTGPFYDIGSADGYYAVGMALRGHKVVGWDVSENARGLAAEVAALNDVEFEQRGEYAGEPTPDGLMLCDIEGAENFVFNRHIAPGLPSVLIEVHEDSHPGTSDRLRKMFERSHDVRRIDRQPREAPGAIRGWTLEEQRRALAEFRPRAMHWLYFTPR